MKPFTEALKYEFDLTPESIVIDAGAHEGNWSHEIWTRYGCKIVALEPIPRYIHETFLRLANTNATIIPMGLGGRSGVTAFHVHGAMSGEFSDGERQMVGMIGVATLLREIRRKIGCIKINIEGGEYELLECVLANGWADQFENIIVQPHSVVQDFEARWKAIDDGLQKTHELVFHESWCWSGYSLRK